LGSAQYSKTTFFGGFSMAQVNIDEILERLSSQIRRALASAVENTIEGPDGESPEFDEYELYREFRRAVRRKCSTWENVNDQSVKKDN
jgi:hypothetical protein